MKVLNQEIGKHFAAYHGDSCEVIRGIPDNSLHYTIFSPPFSNLYVYSNSDRDMGNSVDDNQFSQHFKFLAKELYRAIMPGRLMSFHCMNLPTSKARDGYIGIKDFRGELIRLFIDCGFIYHSEVTIWKDPVVQMQRTKALGLLHKQVTKDSAMSRQGMADYLITMRKPGDNPEPIAGLFMEYVGDDPSLEKYKFNSPAYVEQLAKLLVDFTDGRFGRDSREVRRSIDIWQRYASPVWMDIDQSNTLNRQAAREEQDERHICPLQLDVIHRGLQLWSNPNDIVFSPFMGIGSEGYESIRCGRRFVGCELKESYFNVAVQNLRQIENMNAQQMALF